MYQNEAMVVPMRGGGEVSDRTSGTPSLCCREGKPGGSSTTCSEKQLDLAAQVKVVLV